MWFFRIMEVMRIFNLQLASIDATVFLEVLTILFEISGPYVAFGNWVVNSVMYF